VVCAAVPDEGIDKMKPIIALALIVLFSGCGNPRLSDNYATSALVALKSIQSDAYTPPGETPKTGNPSTVEKLDAADAQGVTAPETNVTSALRDVYVARLHYNQLLRDYSYASRSLTSLTVPFALAHPIYSDMDKRILDSKKEMEKADARVRAVSPMLDDCFALLDSSLRARSTEIPVPCKKVTLE
jgi:hypothetical protein